ncbi:ATP-binding protein [Leptolyngbya sp. AN03gr2]|uniref:ATP-binding protein n=1 Tax=unclassified Leptolyngbya TaxID=2650499 RepID=UPI003D31A112
MQPERDQQQPISNDRIDRRQKAADAADLEDMQRLLELSAQLVTEDDIQAIYQEIVATAIALTRADAGTVQILDEATQDFLVLAAQGFEQEMIDRFYRIKSDSNTSCGMALSTGDRVFVDFDMPNEDPDGSMQMHLEAGYLTAQSTPLMSRSGKTIGMVSTHWRTHHRSSDRELRFLDLLARQAADLIEQRQAQVALRESEEKYRSLFDSINEGYALIELIYDETGSATDWRFLEVNPAFESLTGFSDVAGKIATELNQTLRADWLETFHRVAETGEPERFEQQIEDIDYWFDLSASRLDNDTRQIIVVFNNITDRKRAEQQLRRAAEMDAFQVKLSDALRSLSDAVEVQRTASRVIGEYLEADRVYYADIEPDDEHFVIADNYVRENVPPLIVRGRLADFGWVGEEMRAGRMVRIADMNTEPNMSESARAGFRALNITASLGLPLIKEGRWAASFAVQYLRPHEWSEAEIKLAQETAERTWAAVERAKAEAALREAELQRVREQSEREQERQRAESLAELDRAKTIFFSNVSHEFRTPLTLLLAPLQDALNDRTLPPVHRERLELAHRNSLRLLKLVNTLLDFSRIEAGRMEAVYEPTDLAQSTTELASVFRSAIERAGVRLVVDCPSLSQIVYVDREMWEKIILNLLSNAFKFTFAGKITVKLQSTDDHAIVQIQDTGTGIAPEHLPHLFERFYQVRGARARTYEGSGIGLALVHELVRLQGGTIEVTSTVGVGTCFTIALPFGIEHLPSDRLQDEGDRIPPNRTLASTSIGAAAYVEEAERWQPGEDFRLEIEDFRLEDSSKNHPKSKIQNLKSKILLVDDNADMREYLTRILSEHVQVEAVADGVTALRVAQAQVPDLILSDVMMPELDGFGLLEALRSDSRTREIPIILLSARAGEEAIVEGLEAGADDYLIKPFSAQELVSRVNAHLQIAQLRTTALQEARSTIRSRDELLSTVSHELNTPLVSILGWTRLLRSNPPSPAILTKALDTIERNATVQAALVQDLLDVSRITVGKLRLNLQPVELRSIVEGAIASMTPTAQAKSIHLVWQTQPDHDVVMGDRDRLQQVLCNVLTNAIKFTPQGGSVTVELSTMLDQAEIRVIDTGIGIAADFLPHVFDRFQQARSSDAAKGLGVGLAIAHHIVELHWGTIRAESAGEGQGATFIICLPLFTSATDEQSTKTDCSTQF